MLGTGTQEIAALTVLLTKSTLIVCFPSGPLVMREGLVQVVPIFNYAVKILPRPKLCVSHPCLVQSSLTG